VYHETTEQQTCVAIKIPVVLVACLVGRTERFLSNYQTLDESLAVIMAKINEKSNKTPGKSFILTAMTPPPRDQLTTVAAPRRESRSLRTRVPPGRLIDTVPLTVMI